MQSALWSGAIVSNTGRFYAILLAVVWCQRYWRFWVGVGRIGTSWRLLWKFKTQFTSSLMIVHRLRETSCNQYDSLKAEYSSPTLTFHMNAGLACAGQKYTGESNCKWVGGGFMWEAEYYNALEWVVTDIPPRPTHLLPLYEYSLTFSLATFMPKTFYFKALNQL